MEDGAHVALTPNCSVIATIVGLELSRTNIRENSNSTKANGKHERYTV